MIEGWKTAPLGSICTFISGGTPNKENKNYWGGNFPWVTVKDLKQLTIKNAEHHLTEEGVKSGTRVAPQGSVLILVRGMALLKDLPMGYVDREVTFNQDIKALIPMNGLHGMFLAYALTACKARILDLVDKAGHGTGRLDTELLKDFVIGYPVCPDEQERIIRVLSTWDHIINLTSQLIAAKQQRKYGLMQQLLLGKRRFSEFASENWVEKQLGDLFQERCETGRSDLPLLSITSKEGIIPREAVDRRDTSNEDKSKYLRICKGDIGYNTMRMWQGVSAMASLEGIVSPAYTICVPRAGTDARFMSHLFKFPPMIHLFHRYSQGLVDDTLSLKFDVFARIAVTVPSSEEEQKHIADALDACDQELALLNNKLSLLRKQKQGLMQQLLTGRIRVKT
jgi:type I restriction enzyme, S subunit